MSYGTSDQLSSLLASIGITVAEEPDSMWNDPNVRAASRELADHLYDRLNKTPPVARLTAS